ncbi:hypothetical protein ABZ215_24755 [Amycolatopsis sp. NPDC006131]|uniref:hypothetical protein n=1 Tax=Amycolatopsis sp. NPDC006131 TaxID=3156731 RepID=UPI0033AFDDCE
MPNVSVSHVEPEWLVIAERLHLRIQRAMREGYLDEMCATACGLIATRSALDLRLDPDEVQRCPACRLLEPGMAQGVDAYLAARTS